MRRFWILFGAVIGGLLVWQGTAQMRAELAGLRQEKAKDDEFFHKGLARMEVYQREQDEAFANYPEAKRRYLLEKRIDRAIENALETWEDLDDGEGEGDEDAQ